MAINRNVRTKLFREMLESLPTQVQELALKAYQLFRENPNHPSLKHHPLKDTRKGRHRDGSFAVHISKQYCAIYIPDDDTNVWYWIGTHEDYNNFTGLK